MHFRFLCCLYGNIFAKTGLYGEDPTENAIFSNGFSFLFDAAHQISPIFAKKDSGNLLYTNRAQSDIINTEIYG